MKKPNLKEIDLTHLLLNEISEIYASAAEQAKVEFNCTAAAKETHNLINGDDALQSAVAPSAIC